MCSSRILVAPAAGNFQTAIFKFEVLLSIFCGTKITLEWTTPLPIFRSNPSPIMPYPHINIQIFSPPSLFNILKTPYPPFLNGGVQTMKAFI